MVAVSTEFGGGNEKVKSPCSKSDLEIGRAVSQWLRLEHR